VSDRVESICSPGTDENCRVVDVRGTTFAAGGSELFHVYQPDPAAPDARMLGWEWRRGAATEQSAATTNLVALLRPRGTEQQRRSFVERFSQLNDCVACHTHGKPEAQSGETFLPRRATDASGLYGPQTVLADAAPTETHRPRDRNVDQPFVAVACHGGSAVLEDHGRGARRWVCADGSVPVATLALHHALAAHDPHAAAVCGSRQYLFDHMSAAARQPFAAAFRACGIGERSAHARAR
jgi:hypothetical protein